jgi:hypothetical protein
MPRIAPIPVLISLPTGTRADVHGIVDQNGLTAAFTAAHEISSINLKVVFPVVSSAQDCGLSIKASKAKSKVLLGYKRGNLFSANGLFGKKLLTGTATTGVVQIGVHNCVPPIDPPSCKDLQGPFPLRDSKGQPITITGFSFIIDVHIEGFAANQPVDGTVVLLLQT